MSGEVKRASLGILATALLFWAVSRVPMRWWLFVADTVPYVLGGVFLVLVFLTISLMFADTIFKNVGRRR